MHRRQVLILVGSSSAALAGCLEGTDSDPGRENVDVIAGPDGRPEFAPDEITIATGDHVTWYFDSSGHNVSGVPAHSDEVRLPDGADPFASYDDNPRTLVTQGETYKHQFDIPGRYVYVCIPHVANNMIGTIIVE